MNMQLLEERDAELERSEASLEGHKQAGDVREAVSPLCSPCFKAKTWLLLAALRIHLHG